MPGVACDTEWECHEKGRCPGLEKQSGEGTELASYMAFGQSVCEWVEAGHVKVKSMYVCWGGNVVLFQAERKQWTNSSIVERHGVCM